MSKLIGIGVGVGNPQDITIKAIKAMEEADIIVVPEAKKGMGSTALKIAIDYIDMEKVVYMEFPMIRDKEKNYQNRFENAMALKTMVDEGKTVAFLTIGDPNTFSTYSYILEFLKGKVEIETIGGISSFVSIASTLNSPLVLGDEDLKIISLHKGVDIKKELKNNDNIVFMKLTRSWDRLKEVILELKLENKVVLVSDSGKDKENITYDIKDITREDLPYFSTLIYKKEGHKWFIS